MKETINMKKQGSNKRALWKNIALIAVGGVVAIGLLSAFQSKGDGDLFLKIHRGIDVFGKVYREVAANYVDDVDPDRFMRAGIDGMLKTLDPYTVYLGEKESDEIDLVTSGKYGGIGVTIGLRDGIITVISPIEGFSAAKQGIQPGDRVIEVEGKNVKTMSLEDVRVLVRGAPGTTVHMKIDRDGEPKPLEFVFIREEIPVRNVSYAGFVEDGIGMVRLDRFSRTAGDDVRNAVKELKAKGTLRGLILDIRDNPGGLLDVAVDVVSKFVPESSLVVSTRGRRSDSERKYYSIEKPMAPDVPLAVLVDRGSASASEIVAGAIQDLDRGVIVGTRTFGKGLVQTITRLSENSSLKITSGRYYTPSGRSIQEIDYFHRTKDGVVTIKPDSLRQEYRTAHNRRVLEGGGIVPDSTVLEEPYSKLFEELNRKAMFFKYANQYAAQNKTLPANFEVTDAILKDFEKFLKEKEFSYQEESEIKLRELRQLADKSRYGKSFYEGLDKVSKSIDTEKERAFERYNKELSATLKVEIVSRIKGEKAGVEASFADDPQLKAAVSLLKNKPVYSVLLKGGSKK
ncbi:MAG: S41 family peptidase [Ignavibacteriales bacterium]|nr:S41 family peptidase [Ignavibacteriales bacterium]